MALRLRRSWRALCGVHLHKLVFICASFKFVKFTIISRRGSASWPVLEAPHHPGSSSSLHYRGQDLHLLPYLRSLVVIVFGDVPSEAHTLFQVPSRPPTCRISRSRRFHGKSRPAPQSWEATPFLLSFRSPLVSSRRVATIRRPGSGQRGCDAHAVEQKDVLCRSR